ncbi:MAG: SWIM zinc finger family protein [Phascolarctobacterium faecium]
MTFGNWDASIHSKIDQIKRINTAKQIKNKNIVSIDAQRQTAKISGSSGELYEVTLNHCTCFDFNAQRGPCKHIYKLAAERAFYHHFLCLMRKRPKLLNRVSLQKSTALNNNILPAPFLQISL